MFVLVNTCQCILILIGHALKYFVYLLYNEVLKSEGIIFRLYLLKTE